MSITERIKSRPGAVAFLASAMVFGVLSLVRAPKAGLSPSRAMVPVMTRLVAAGQTVSRQDWRWVPESALRAVKVKQVTGVARVPLEPGQVLSPAVLGGVAATRVTVAVTPASAADARIARVGSSVDVLVRYPGSVAWQSGPVPVVAVSAQVGADPSISVLMSFRQAMQYEGISRHGIVEILGMDS